MPLLAQCLFQYFLFFFEIVQSVGNTVVVECNGRISDIAPYFDRYGFGGRIECVTDK